MAPRGRAMREATEAQPLPSRPLAPEIGFTRFRQYSLAEVGNIRLRLRVASEASRVGGLHLLRARGCPPPLTPPRHSLRSRGEGNGEEVHSAATVFTSTRKGSCTSRSTI